MCNKKRREPLHNIIDRWPWADRECFVLESLCGEWRFDPFINESESAH